MANTLDLGSAFGWVGNLGVMLLGLLVIGAFGFLFWYLKNKHMNFKYEVFIEEKRGMTTIPVYTRGRFEVLKDNKVVLVLQNNTKKNIGTVTFKNVLPGNKIRLYRKNEDIYEPLDVTIENDTPEYKLILDDQMRFTFAGTMEKIYLLTKKDDLMSQFGHIIWLIVAAVLLVVVMYPAMDASGKAAQAYAEASANFQAATENMVRVVGGAGSAVGEAPPVPFIIAPEVHYAGG